MTHTSVDETATRARGGKAGALRQTLRWCGFVLIAALPSAAVAQQPDAEYLARQALFGDQWASEDQEVSDNIKEATVRYRKGQPAGRAW